MKKIIFAIATLALMLCMLAVSASAADHAGRRLANGSIEKEIYNALKPQIAAVADGSSTYTALTVSVGVSELKWTAADLGCAINDNGTVSAEAQKALSQKFNQKVNMLKVLYSLQADLPYELYWFDYTEGISVGYSVSATDAEISIASITVYFSVSKDFVGSAEYTVDPAKTTLAKTAVANARAIVNENKDKTDRQKLDAYYKKICELVSYNNEATAKDAVFGNASQLLYVFDGDPNTNVMCEGYAKAFQYLCDISEFDGNVACYTVHGRVIGGIGSDAHSWNIVNLNGTNYLVDITNCDVDGGTPISSLFMVRTNGTGTDGATYRFDLNPGVVIYTYDTTQKDLFCNGYPKMYGYTGEVPGGSKIVVNADVTGPVAGQSPSFEVTVDDDTLYTATIVSWYDIVTKKNMTKDDVFIEGYKYEMRIDFAPVGSTVLDENTVYTINGDTASTSYGAAYQRSIVFEALPADKIPYNIKITGGEAKLNNELVNQAKPGDWITISPINTPANKSFFKWSVYSGNVMLSNEYSAQTSFVMPEGDVVIEAQYLATHGLKKVEALAPTCTSAGHKEYWSCAHCDNYFADSEALKPIGDKAALEAWLASGGEGYIAPVAHVFDQQIATDAYLKKPATCTEPAEYYFSCVCGASQENLEVWTLFIAGETLPHNFSSQQSDAEYHWNKCADCEAVDESSKQAHSGGTASCTAKAVCSVCSQSYGETAPHVFDREIQDAKYKLNESTYYKSCVCGTTSTETFTVEVPDDSGCKSSISALPIAIVSIWGLAITSHKKKFNK